MEKQERSSFSSRVGFVLAAAGSAVGLGNLWRFPYLAARYGGGIFLLVYLILVVTFGFSLMITEFAIGRKTKLSCIGAYGALDKRFSFLGWIAAFVPLIITPYYCVIGGWVMKYLWTFISGGALEAADNGGFFSRFISFDAGSLPATMLNFSGPTPWFVLFVLITGLVVIFGVQKGIERSAKILMPLLFVILIILSVHSLLMPGGGEGVRFLFRPDFSKVTPSTVLVALGQAFFSLSIGIGTMVTYASYFKPDTNLRHTALNVTILDTLVAILAGVVIFPAVFSVGIEPSSGPSLVFITLPGIFNSMPLSMVWSSVFFLLLVVAALTSTISLHEVITAYLHEEWHMSRRAAAWATTGACMALAAVASLSLGLLDGWRILGLSVFDSLDFLTANILLPAGGFFTCIFVGWRLDQKVLKGQISNDGELKFRIYGVFIFLLRYICPAVLLLIFLDNLGLF